MNDVLLGMIQDQIAVDMDNLRNREESIYNAIDAIEEDNFIPTWHISIFSGWATDGEKSLEKDYQMDNLRDAIRHAATDFGILNGRGYPGKQVTLSTSSSYIQKSWDVQGSWSISLKIGDWSMILPSESYNHHVEELTEETDEIWGPEAKEKSKPKVPLID